MATCLGSPFHLCCGEGGILQISLEYVGSTHSVWTTLGLPQLMAAWQRVLSRSTLLRLQVALQGYCPKQALHFLHFPNLSCSGSVSQVLSKGTDSVGGVFGVLPWSEQLRCPATSQVYCPRWTGFLNHLPGRGHSVSWVHCESTVSGVPYVSSEELISGCNPPGRCQPSRIP